MSWDTGNIRVHLRLNTPRFSASVRHRLSLLSGREQKETGGSSKGDKGFGSRNCPLVEGLRRPERSEGRRKPSTKGQRLD